MKSTFAVYWSFALGAPKEKQVKLLMDGWSEVDAVRNANNYLNNHLIWIHSAEKISK